MQEPGKPTLRCFSAVLYCKQLRENLCFTEMKTLLNNCHSELFDTEPLWYVVWFLSWTRRLSTIVQHLNPPEVFLHVLRLV